MFIKVILLYLVLIGIFAFGAIYSHIQIAKIENQQNQELTEPKIQEIQTTKEVKTTQEVTSLPQRQAAFKSWALKLLKNADDIDKQWNQLDSILDANNTSEIYHNLSVIQDNIENLKKQRQLIKVPMELSAEQIKQLQSSMDTWDMGLFYKIKAIKLSKEYLETQKPSIGSQIIDAKHKAHEFEVAGADIISNIRKELDVNLN